MYHKIRYCIVSSKKKFVTVVYHQSENVIHKDTEKVIWACNLIVTKMYPKIRYYSVSSSDPIRIQKKLYELVTSS